MTSAFQFQLFTRIHSHSVRKTSTISNQAICKSWNIKVTKMFLQSVVAYTKFRAVYIACWPYIKIKFSPPLATCVCQPDAMRLDEFVSAQRVTRAWAHLFYEFYVTVLLLHLMIIAGIRNRGRHKANTEIIKNNEWIRFVCMTYIILTIAVNKHERLFLARVLIKQQIQGNMYSKLFFFC